jgi:hypothetical protein
MLYPLARPTNAAQAYMEVNRADLRRAACPTSARDWRSFSGSSCSRMSFFRQKPPLRYAEATAQRGLLTPSAAVSSAAIGRHAAPRVSRLFAASIFEKDAANEGPLYRPAAEAKRQRPDIGLQVGAILRGRELQGRHREHHRSGSSWSTGPACEVRQRPHHHHHHQRLIEAQPPQEMAPAVRRLARLIHCDGLRKFSSGVMLRRPFLRVS